MPKLLLSVPLALLVLVLCQRNSMGDLEPGLLLMSTDDILNEHLMPLTLLMLDAEPGEPEVEGAESRTMDQSVPFRFETLVNGSVAGSGGRVVGHANETSYSRALSTMEFHRTMFNRYRCNGFLAKRILHQAYQGQPTQLSKRMSSGTDRDGRPIVPNALLYDPGSSGYREWLTKTATMDDIYRNYLSGLGGMADTAAGEESMAADQQQQQHPRHRPPPASEKMGTEKLPGEPQQQQQEQELGFDEGFITGYAVPTSAGGGGPRYHPTSFSYQRQQQQQQQQQQQRGKQHQAQGGSGRQWELLEGETDSGYARGDTLWSHPGASHHHHAALFEPEHQVVQEKQLGKPAGGGSVGLKDLFDIALTTLAFLSFGMFILQVIMCITMTKSEAGMMVLPTQPIEVEVDGGEVRRDRFARQLPEPEPVPAAVSELNQLAGHALTSIDVMLDDGVGSDRRAPCLQRSLCQANRFSRTLTTISAYWVSIWSLAICWMAGVNERPLGSTTRDTPATATVALHCLSASIVGIGNGNCSKLYPCPVGRS